MRRANSGGPSQLQAARLVAAVAEVGLLRGRKHHEHHNRMDEPVNVAEALALIHTTVSSADRRMSQSASGVRFPVEADEP